MRRSTRRKALLLRAAIVILYSTCGEAMACQCGSSGSLAEGWERSTLVFDGDLIDRWPTLIHLDGFELPAEVATLRVRRVWKGPAVNEVRLLNDGNSCAYHFSDAVSIDAAHPRRFLVFASDRYSRTGDLVASHCDPNGPIAEAGPLLSELGPGRAVETSGPTGALSQRLRSVARPVVASWLVGRVLVRHQWHESVSDVEHLWTMAALVAIGLLGSVIVFLRSERRGRLFLYGVSAMSLVLPLAVLLVGYVYCRTSVWLSFLVS
jgi:hypothetical protein